MSVLQNFINFVTSIPEISIQKQIISELNTHDIITLLSTIQKYPSENTGLIKLLKSINIFKKVKLKIAFNNLFAWIPSTVNSSTAGHTRNEFSCGSGKNTISLIVDPVPIPVAMPYTEPVFDPIKLLKVLAEHFYDDVVSIDIDVFDNDVIFARHQNSVNFTEQNQQNIVDFAVNDSWNEQDESMHSDVSIGNFPINLSSNSEISVDSEANTLDSTENILNINEIQLDIKPPELQKISLETVVNSVSNFFNNFNEAFQNTHFSKLISNKLNHLEIKVLQHFNELLTDYIDRFEQITENNVLMEPCYVEGDLYFTVFNVDHYKNHLTSIYKTINSLLSISQNLNFFKFFLEPESSFSVFKNNGSLYYTNLATFIKRSLGYGVPVWREAFATCADVEFVSLCEVTTSMAYLVNQNDSTLRDATLKDATLKNLTIKDENSTARVSESCISFLNNLSKLPHLNKLRITDCNPQMLAAISNCTNLKTLSIDELRVESDTIIDSMTELLKTDHNHKYFHTFPNLKKLEISRILYYDVEEIYENYEESDSFFHRQEITRKGKLYSLVNQRTGLFSERSLNILFPKLSLLEFNADSFPDRFSFFTEAEKAPGLRLFTKSEFAELVEVQYYVNQNSERDQDFLIEICGMEVGQFFQCFLEDMNEDKQIIEVVLDLNTNLPAERWTVNVRHDGVEL